MDSEWFGGSQRHHLNKNVLCQTLIGTWTIPRFPFVRDKRYLVGLSLPTNCPSCALIAEHLRISEANFHVNLNSIA